jgi:hypothetical protein
MNVIGRFILIGGAINAEIALAVPAGKEPGETTAVGSLTRV